MSDFVKISVVIPVYNAQDYLHQTLDSLIHQTLREIEIICVDDGSTDRSLEILNEYAAKDSRVRVLTQKNQYAGAARNAGMAIARGEYIHFLDSDDYMNPGAYELLYARATALNADMVKANRNLIDSKTSKELGVLRSGEAPLPQRALEKPLCFFDNPDLFGKINVVPWNGIYKLAFLRANSIEFNRLFCVNDRSFFKEVILHAKRVVLIPDIIVNHRINLQTSLVGQRAKHFECHFESYRIIERMGTALPVKLRAAYMNPEMNDVLGWFRTLSKGPYGEQITRQTLAFLEKTDISPMLVYCRELSWLQTWIELTEKLLSSPACMENPERKPALQTQLQKAKRRMRMQNCIAARAWRKGMRIVRRLAGAN